MFFGDLTKQPGVTFQKSDYGAKVGKKNSERSVPRHPKIPDLPNSDLKSEPLRSALGKADFWMEKTAPVFTQSSLSSGGGGKFFLISYSGSWSCETKNALLEKFLSPWMKDEPSIAKRVFSKKPPECLQNIAKYGWGWRSKNRYSEPPVLVGGTKIFLMDALHRSRDYRHNALLKKNLGHIV